MATPIANQRQTVMVQLLDQLDEPHREILREFAADADRDLDQPLLSADIREAVGDSTFARYLSDLREWSLVTEIGEFVKSDGKKQATRHSRYQLTGRGRSLVSKYGPEFDPKQLQGEVDPEPEVRSNPEPVGREPDSLTDLSPSVDTFIENTESVELHEGIEHRPEDPKGTVKVVLNHEGASEVIEFPAVNWHNSGLNHFFDRLHAAFGAGHDLDRREFGILQQRWIDMAEVVDHADRDGEDGEVSD